MPLMDEYGGHRPGNNLFGNSLVALDVKTGKRKWHFQMVHHDIWDYDTPMAPNLLDVTVDGKPRKVIAQTTQAGVALRVRSRDGRTDLADRRDAGARRATCRANRRRRRSRFRRKPAPYAQQGLVEADLIDYTPAIKEAALKLAKACRMGPYFIPASPGDGTAPSGLSCSWYAPGASGGVNIDGGAAVDPETGLLYVAAQNGLSTMQVVKDPCSEFRYSSPHDSCGELGAPAPPAGYKKSDGRGAGGRTRRRKQHWRRVDREAEGAWRHHGVQHELRRQGLVDPERRPAAAGRDEGRALCRRDAAAGGARAGPGADHHDQERW